MTSPAPLQLAPSRRRYSLDGRIGRLTVRGRDLTADLAALVHRASLTLSTTQVDALTLGLSDPGDAVLASRLFDEGGAVDYADLRLRVYHLDSTAPGLVPLLEVRCEDLGAAKLRDRRGVLVRSNYSHDAAVRELAGEQGLRAVTQPFPKVPTLILRAAPSQPGQPAESSYEALMRLATEVGALAFVSRGTVYFGRPSWLVRNLPRVPVAWRGARTADALLARPTLSRSLHARPRTATLDCELHLDLAEQLPPGVVLDFTGVPTFDGLYLTESLSYDLGATAATLKASQPVDPVPQPPEPAAGRAAAGQPGPAPAAAPSGHRSALEFVRIAVTQAGDRYVFGAEARPNDPDPDAFDCSELVQWGLARVGVTFVDGSVAQINACRPISVEQAIRTRGALLFRPGKPSNHIAISLGNGRTIEARGRRYGVVEASAHGRFARGGLVPGLRY